MKKLLILILGITLFYSCSSSSEENGNTTVAPVPPTNLTGAVASTTQINLTWTDNSTNETGFKIERKTGTGTYVVVGTTATDVTTFSDVGLTPSTTYTYRVYSYNSAGNSPTYSNEISLITTLSDIDGNTYEQVTICNQTWTKSNLNVSKYSDGTPIPQITDPTQWANLTTGAWCYYNNDPASEAILGKLYNWYAVAGIYDAASLANPAIRKKLAPTGWHIPSVSEWTVLLNCLGGSSIAGGKMKSTGIQFWSNPNVGATNESNFSAIGSGYRSHTAFNPNFLSLYNESHFYSSESYNNDNSWYITLYRNNTTVWTNWDFMRYGRSVRCVKD